MQNTKKNTNDFKCHFCSKREGFMNKLLMGHNTLKWTHVKCVKWFLKKMTIEIKDCYLLFKLAKDLPNSIFLANGCTKCHKTKKDFFVGCQSEGCDKNFHSECIEPNMYRELDSDERIKSIAFYCEEHSKQIIKFSKLSQI